MRVVALSLLLITGCIQPDTGVPERCGAITCEGGEVCANTEECWPADGVRTVTVRWTVGGAPAGADTCAATPELELSIMGPSTGRLRTYAPVPCDTGRFAFTALPDADDRAKIYSPAYTSWDEDAIPAEGGDVLLDLPVP
jgi:hypothetical protein